MEEGRPPKELAPIEARREESRQVQRLHLVLMWQGHRRGTCEKWRALKPKDCQRGEPPPNKSEEGAKRPAGAKSKDGKQGIA
jgi:hypothetical protein